MSHAPDRVDGALDEEGRDLTDSAAAGELPTVVFRDALVDHVRTLLERRRSVLLVGPHGVGRTSIAYAVAARTAADRRETAWLQRIVEWPAAQFLTGTRYVGDWQTKVDAVVRAAWEAGVAVFVPDVARLRGAGRTTGASDDVLSQLRPALQTGRLVLLGEVTPQQWALLEGTPELRALFERVPVPPLGPEETAAIVAARAAELHLALTPGAAATVRDLCARFLSRAPAPGPELHLLARLADDVARGARGASETLGTLDAGPAPTVVDEPFVERVFAADTGLPRFVVSSTERCATEDVRGYFAERIVGQAPAIEAVIETIALFKAGLADPTRPIGSFLFVGPTGVGKTELARALAAFLFGSAGRLLRVDLSELKDYLAIEQLVGSARNPEQRARLLEPVRAQPFQVVLLDELEKAHPDVWDLLLPLLDEGQLTAADGERVDFRSTIVVCTSNAGAGLPERSVGFGRPTEGADRAAYETRVRAGLEAAFRPELLNRFQRVVVFHPLSPDDVRRIARQELDTIFARQGFVRRRLTVEVEDEALDHVAQAGFDARYGARALKREVERLLVLPLARALMERAPPPGSVLRVAVRDARIVVRVDDTEESRALVREATPVPLEPGRTLTREGAAAWLAELGLALRRLADRLDRPALEARLEALMAEQAGLGGWPDAARATRLAADVVGLRELLQRLDRHAEHLVDLGAGLGPAVPRDALAALAPRLLAADASLRRTWREVCVYGEEGAADAYLLITPAGGPGNALAVDFLTTLYTRWATARRLTVHRLCEPVSEAEPVLLHIVGACVHGRLRGESGWHRVRPVESDPMSAAQVRVVPAEGRGDAPPVRALEQRPLEARGREVAAALRRHPVRTGEVPVVRRYVQAPPFYRDDLLGERSGRTAGLSPDAFDELLCRRAERLSDEVSPFGPSSDPTSP
jgi:ATP-dependent Clp protease ATP-binding subunit ClpC